MIHLYDLDFKGCISCFACKLKGGKSYGKCAVKDGLTPVLEKLEDADAVILGSPIYFGNVTGEMRSFMERFFFQYLVYSTDPQSLYPKNIPVGFIYTMNVTEDLFEIFGINKLVELNERVAARLFGCSESLYSTDTYQLMTTQNTLLIGLTPKKKQKGEKKCSRKTARKPLKWEPGS